jgi:F-type H+-transporting ATPase subunit b
MISIDQTLFIQVVNFLVLIFVLNILLYKPILGIIDRRNRRIAESDEKVKELNESVEQKMAEYEEKLRQAKLEAMEQKNKIEQEGSEEGERLIEGAKSEISQMVEVFHVKMGKEIDEVRGILKGQSQKISGEIADKVLGRSVQ